MVDWTYKVKNLTIGEMDGMKANKKYKLEEDEAVSAVIGVILMVAITVAIAATVYVYVSGMIGGTQTQTPGISFTVDAANDKITVASADSGISWDDVYIKTDNANANLSWNGKCAFSFICYRSFISEK